MIRFTEPVKFLGKSTRTNQPDSEKDWSVDEATLFIGDLGRIKVQVGAFNTSTDHIKLPAKGEMINLELDVELGKFGAPVLLWNENARFQKVAA